MSRTWKDIKYGQPSLRQGNRRMARFNDIVKAAYTNSSIHAKNSSSYISGQMPPKTGFESGFDREFDNFDMQFTSELK